MVTARPQIGLNDRADGRAGSAPHDEGINAALRSVVLQRFLASFRQFIVKGFEEVLSRRSTPQFGFHENLDDLVLVAAAAMAIEEHAPSVSVSENPR